jgi:hypothetical protein
MALVTANTTCDIYRSGNSPPAAPDVAGVACFLQEDFGRSHEASITGGVSGTVNRWTHTLLVSPAVDIRDGYLGTPAGEGSPSGWDNVYVPDKNGTKFAVVFVARVGLGTPGDCQKAYLQRQTPGWPTHNL